MLALLMWSLSRTCPIVGLTWRGKFILTVTYWEAFIIAIAGPGACFQIADIRFEITNFGLRHRLCENYLRKMKVGIPLLN